MDRIFEQMTSWLKDWIVDGLMSLRTGTFDSINAQVGSVAADVATSPADFTPGVFSLMKTVSNNAIMPIAGMILTFIACYELIQLVIAHNNLANFETWIFFKWIFKTYVAVMARTYCGYHCCSGSSGINHLGSRRNWYAKRSIGWNIMIYQLLNNCFALNPGV